MSNFLDVQGHNQISGYYNDEFGLFKDVPVIIFGDHTRNIKYINTPLFLGADGVKLLKVKRNIDADCKYLYYQLCNCKIPETGYNRHFKWLKEIKIKVPSLAEQKKVVSILDKITDLINLRKKEIEKLDLMVKSRFVEMFGDPILNPKKWNTFSIGARCNIITGNTPPRADKENYGHFIEWIKSDNINNPNTFLTKAEEYLSEKGASIGRCVDVGSVLMTCIAGSLNCIGNVGVADRRVAFNQQINAIVPIEDETLYIYWLLLLSKPYIQSTINMALKGILSKGQLSVITLPFPPKTLQRQFIAFVEQIDKSKLVVKKSLEKLETLKKSLMQKYFY